MPGPSALSGQFRRPHPSVMAATISVDVVLPCSGDRARAGLDVMRQELCDRETAVVGPYRHRWPTRRVHVALTDPREAGRTAVSELRWDPTGAWRTLLPTL